MFYSYKDNSFFRRSALLRNSPLGRLAPGTSRFSKIPVPIITISLPALILRPLRVLHELPECFLYAPLALESRVHVKIQRGVGAGMAEKHRERFQVLVRSQRMGGEGVPQRVNVGVHLNSRRLQELFEMVLQSPLVVLHQKTVRGIFPRHFLQSLEQIFRDGDFPVAAFAFRRTELADGLRELGIFHFGGEIFVCAFCVRVICRFALFIR